MTETTADAPETEPTPRRRFVVARLADALRRQDWFTVGVEVAIVVIGVVIGFQVTAWGQGRADRTQEQGYLHQLAADLRETGREVARADSVTAPHDRAGTRLLHVTAFAEPPPQDSLYTWVVDADWYEIARPVLSTAQALVATGDLSLVRDDSLRSEITGYLARTEEHLRDQQSMVEWFNDAFRPLYERIDYQALILGYMTADARADGIDSLAAAEPYFDLPAGPRRALPTPELYAVLTEPNTRGLLYQMNIAKQNLKWGREQIREESEALLVHVEAHIEP